MPTTLLAIGFSLGFAAAILLGSIIGWRLGWFRARELSRTNADLDQRLKTALRSIEQTKVRHKALVAELAQHREGEERLREQRAADEDIFRRSQAEIQTQQQRLADVETALERIVREKDRVFQAGRKAYLRYRECERQLQAIARDDGAFWDSPPSVLPEFVPRDKRRAVIVAVMNLKGGVGKTTVTANLGFALSKKKQRVLLVDLDHQASLTSLCLPARDVESAWAVGGPCVDRVFDTPGDCARVAVESLLAIDSFPSGGACLAASPQLLAIEERLKAKWMLRDASVGDGVDTRFILRRALHALAIESQFDWILIDCPPRPTAACVNALAAADLTLIPTILDKVSAGGLPLMLGWLRLLKERGICPELDVLGVLPNGTRWKTKLTNREKDVWDRLERLAADAWPRPIEPFATFIPTKGGFAEAAERGLFAAAGKEIAPLFDALAKEILTRRANHERRKPADAPA